MSPVALSTVRLDPARGMLRESPRPAHLRPPGYDDKFDWDTLFYDVYHAGREVVFQGPPLFNLEAGLRASAPFPGALRGLFPRARIVHRNRADELRLKTDADRVIIDGPLGRFDIAIQPDEAHRFAGRRVIHTLSRNNAPRWIADWVRFYVTEHGADAVLLYDNASTAYSTGELRAMLAETFPGLAIIVVDWPFHYGPQGGLAGSVDGVTPTEWDSDYCQTGSMQHARFRFLRTARSVLNVDIDELVLPERGRTIFEAAERARGGFIKFPGRWVSAASDHAVTRASCRHGDFAFIDTHETEECPPKWCLVPASADDIRHTWSVHNLFDARANKRIDRTFLYRHFKGVTDNWKYDRWDAEWSPGRFLADEPLVQAMTRAGLAAGAPAGAEHGPTSSMASVATKV